ncbi:hypothetical protein O165_012030 [Pseudomonas soli]|nr:hypothetical protein O165_012030 [Pseudomonas soli]
MGVAWDLRFGGRLEPLRIIHDRVESTTWKLQCKQHWKREVNGRNSQELIEARIAEAGEAIFADA